MLYGRRLILNDGTVIENGTAGYSSGVLWCYFTGYTLAQMAEIFLNTEKTSKIRFQYGDMEDVYDGFTNCISLFVEDDGKCNAGLRKAGEEI